MACAGSVELMIRNSFSPNAAEPHRPEHKPELPPPIPCDVKVILQTIIINFTVQAPSEFMMHRLALGEGGGGGLNWLSVG